MRIPDPHWLDLYHTAATPPAKLRAALKAFFDIDTSDAAPYFCPVALTRKEAALDLLALDDLLHERHGEYEEEGLSMRELIIREYGEEAANFVSSSY